MSTILSLIDSQHSFDLSALSQTLPRLRDRLYVVGFDLTSDPPLVDLSLTQLARCYDVAARHQPQLDMIPLLPAAGWTISEP